MTGRVALPALREALLAHLRETSGCADLAYRHAPEPMAGGFSTASIHAFELEAAPAGLDGPLVLRVLSGSDSEPRWARETLVQGTAARLGFPTPRLRLVGAEAVGLGGPFVVMDRLAGGKLIRWWTAWLLAGVGAAWVLGSPWPLLVGHAVGCACVGLVMARYQRRLHRLPVASVREACVERGVAFEALSARVWMDTAQRAITAQRLDGYAPGLQWLRAHEPAIARAVLCHGDIQPLNFMATWTRVTGILDWELACVADPELDVATTKCDVLLLPGPWLGAVFWPLYAFYVLGLGRGLDRARLRYYEALRAFVMLAMVAEQFRATQANKAAGVPEPAGTAPDLPPFFARMLIRAHERRFRRLTGVAIAERA